VTDLPPGQNPTDTSEVKQLGRLRVALDELVRELRVWIDLLRNKALALRAVGPGPLNPRKLADALAASGTPPRQRRPTAKPRPVGDDDAADLLREATELWDTVADPGDSRACRELADSADRLADRLEDRWRDARDQLRSVSHAFDRAEGAADDR
jgi:hypothetical protein